MHKKHFLVSVLLGMRKGISLFFLKMELSKKNNTKHWEEDKKWRLPVIILSIYILSIIKNHINIVLAIIHFYITTNLYFTIYRLCDEGRLWLEMFRWSGESWRWQFLRMLQSIIKLKTMSFHNELFLSKTAKICIIIIQSKETKRDAIQLLSSSTGFIIVLRCAPWGFEFVYFNYS